MASSLFPSGQWVGFYTYSGKSRKFLMDLGLEFAKGRIHGEGADGVGFFVITGRYSEKTRECDWNKTYVGRHTVSYRGYREGKGIWGTWNLFQGKDLKGGFHIWPLSEGPPIDPLVKEEEEDVELVTAAPVKITSVPPSAPISLA